MSKPVWLGLIVAVTLLGVLLARHPSVSALHRRLLAMPAPERNHIFHMILQDAGADCIEVLSSDHMADEISTWHAHCGATRTYSVVLDDFGSRVYPIPYGDFNSQVPTTIEPQ